MKRIWQPIEIQKIVESGNKTILQVATSLSKEEILKYSTTSGLSGEIKFDDKRLISSLQRKKIFATLRDIAMYTGYEVEELRQIMQYNFCIEAESEYFSLSSCSLEIAREFTNHLIEFVVMNDIPLAELAIERTDEIGKYLFYCLKHSKCCICNKEGITYTINNKREKMCLCDSHYDTAKAKGLEQFNKIYKVYGIKYIG